MENNSQPIPLSDKRTVVVGVSLKKERFSNIAVRRLKEHNVPVIAIGLREGEIKETHVHIPFPEVENIHTVTMYVGPRNQPFWYDFILNLKPKRVIFNPGTENAEFQKKLKDLDVEIIEDCTLVMLSKDEF
ncbi:MAG: CoA-binding protein [Bacteroidetes bacterium]|nr:CoA-binding protein [Bacteroidota bacterium]